MREEKKEIDQRESYRCAVAPSRRDAELKCGRRRLPVQLFNESAGGFAAWCDRPPKLEAGELVQVSTDGGCFECRVVYVSEVRPPGDPTEPAVGYRLGLERLQELEAPSRENTAPLSRGRRLGPSNSSLIAMVTLLVSIVLLSTVVLMGKLPLAQDGRINRPVEKAPLVQSPPDPAFQELVRQLELTQSQQEQVQVITRQAAGALQEFDAKWIDDTPQERARKQAAVLEATRREIRNLLTEEQRERWKSLLE